MPNRWTFTIAPVRDLLAAEMAGGVWIDAFAGQNSPATITNDLNPAMPADYHMDALEFVRSIADLSADGVLHDPPYSITQAVECYAGHGMELLDVKPSSMKYWAELKNEYARILRVGGKAICFGWNTNGLGTGRGFEMQKIMIVPHGGSKNDTLVTVEVKVQATL